MAHHPRIELRLLPDQRRHQIRIQPVLLRVRHQVAPVRLRKQQLPIHRRHLIQRQREERNPAMLHRLQRPRRLPIRRVDLRLRQRSPLTRSRTRLNLRPDVFVQRSIRQQPRLDQMRLILRQLSRQRRNHRLRHRTQNRRRSSRRRLRLQHIQPLPRQHRIVEVDVRSRQRAIVVRRLRKVVFLALRRYAHASKARSAPRSPPDTPVSVRPSAARPR